MLLLAVTTFNFRNIREYRKLPGTLLFVRFVNTVHRVMQCNALAKKLKSWFNDTKGKCDVSFSSRFRGQESRALQRHLHVMGRLLLRHMRSEDALFVIRIHKQAVALRKGISMSTRITSITSDDILELQRIGHTLHKICATYDNIDMTPTMWSMANIMPVHSMVTFERYGFGLGCNSMEGREQKHQKIAGYHNHAHFNNRWYKAFQHEFVELWYLRMNGLDRKTYQKRSINYVPDNSFGCATCKGELEADHSCVLCDNPNSAVVEEEISRSLETEY